MTQAKSAEQDQTSHKSSHKASFSHTPNVVFFMTRLYSYFKMFICCDMLSLSLYSFSKVSFGGELSS